MKRKIFYLVIVLVILGFFLKNHEFHDIESFTITYHTGALPPPHNYDYVLKGGVTRDGLEVDYKIKFVSRGDIPEQELIEHGYTKDDNFHWAGTLDNKWKTEIKELIEKTKWIKEPGERPGGDSLRIEISDGHKHLVEGTPGNRDTWDAFLSRLFAEIYKIAGKKMPPRALEHCL